MKALKLATTPKDQQALDAKSKELLTKAENIKESMRWRPTNGDINVKRASSPERTRRLTTREEIILLEGSKLNGFIFPPCNRPPDWDEFELDDEGQLFTYVTILVLRSSMFMA